ncbi:hypothetical protein [uncultured Roseicyclus sp.]|jgi:hypothetical protein|uniref:hypothetical protein n=1 Tax=uncultured Roseicyclus sp. TaxID=543072 RepID=UPI002606E4A1|nr:hypothetical protein [uncultured Roseicyclus sp.]
MTALEQYSRLEATGLWREGPDAQRSEVLVSLGKATLVIATPAEVVRTHWSLPALIRLNPGKHPAIYAPSPQTDEELEIDDALMVEAIEKLRISIERRRPHPGRLRLWIGASLGAGMLALALLWMPDALIRQTVSLLPAASREAIGTQLLQEIGRLAGPICTAPRGSAALTRLARRALGETAPRVAILPASIPDTLSLPGGIIVVDAGLVEDHDTPEVLAGFLLAEAARRTETDPVLRLLSEAGLGVTLRLLTTGQIDSATLRAHAVKLLSAETAPAPQAALIARFAAAGISAQPYAALQDASDPAGLALRAEAPADVSEAATLISDADWVSLQDICAR